MNAWKSNWAETRQHMLDWWDRKGLVIGQWDPPRGETPHEEVEDPGPAFSREYYHSDPLFRARCNHWGLAHSDFPADILPISDTNIGPGTLALYLGCKPEFASGTVWYHPTMDQVEEPANLPPLRFDPENRWWKITEATLREAMRLSRGRYLVGCPDLIENIDILASLRDNNVLLMDMAVRPDWVDEKMREINRAFFEAYSRIYDIIREEDGSSSFEAFRIWGPGKTAKLQSDASAMISPAMFDRFVAPALKEQCDWLDNSLFHLDGHQCICHLDSLLAIESLDAIEWTPDPQVPDGGDPHWYPMYRKILAAGKSLQIVSIAPRQIIPLLDAVGGKGIYILTGFHNRAEAEEIVRKAEQYR